MQPIILRRMTVAEITIFQIKTLLTPVSLDRVIAAAFGVHFKGKSDMENIKLIYSLAKQLDKII